MLSTDIAPVSYRSNKGSLPATRTTDIPGRERSRGIKTQRYRMRLPQAAKVGSIEFRSLIAEAISRFWTEYHCGTCFISHVDPKRVLVVSEKTCCGTIIFREARFLLAPAWARLREPSRCVWWTSRLRGQRPAQCRVAGSVAAEVWNCEILADRMNKLARADVGI